MIEARPARSTSVFTERRFEQQVSVDYVAYLSGNERYWEMAVFIYDESCSGQHHGTTRNTLRALPGITNVIIVSQPSRLPDPPRPPRQGRRSSSTVTYLPGRPHSD